jgi:glycerate kinase
LVQDLPLQPKQASTFGTGELLLAAMASGARQVILGIGGSATNDGGLGVAVALGWRFFRANGSAFQPTLVTILEAVRIERPADPLPEILVACDVDNPLLGPRGATRVYGRGPPAAAGRRGRRRTRLRAAGLRGRKIDQRL